MPALFDDVMKGIPAEQKEKLEGMIKIWEKGNTFPAKMLAEFRTRLSGEVNKAAVQTNGAPSQQKAGGGEKFSAPVPSRPSHTPIGFPPQHLYDNGFIPKQPQTNGTIPAQTMPQPAAAHAAPQQQPAPPQQQQPQDVNSILKALANMPKPAPQPAAPQATPQPAPVQHQQNAQPQPQLPPNIAALFAQQNGMPGMPAPPRQQQPILQQAQLPNLYQMPPNLGGFAPQPPPSVPQPYAQAPPPPQPPADPLGPLRNILPPNILNDQQKLVPALQLLQDLQKNGIPMEQWGPVIQAFEEQYKPPPTQTAYGSNGGYNDFGGSGRSPAPRRPSPVYGSYDDMARNDRRGGDNNRYRQRSPMRDSPVPLQTSGVAMNGNPMQPKYITFDSSLPHDSIKVLSRTLFVGGANGTQAEIQELFQRLGRVQSCIANREKRHAFVKMTTRRDALDAKATMERLQTANDAEIMRVARQTKWGVGFGPRECCNYPNGESIIPIHKLTDADMKWLLTAEYGGTGGRKVEGGMVLEEPDIEIGAGVSSKAMSKRVLPEQGQPNSNKRQHREEGGQHRDRGRNERKRGQMQDEYGGGYSGVSGGGAPPQPMPMQMEHYGYARPEPVAVATPPAVPGFGGFTLPGASGQQYR